MSTVPGENGVLSLRERAYSRLRRLLILQQIAEGQRLREAECARRTTNIGHFWIRPSRATSRVHRKSFGPT